MADADADPSARTVVVNANDPRTHIGHFHAGQRVHISILDAAWTDAPDPDLLDARGSRTRRCVNTLHRACIGNGAPFMGLVLITVTDAEAAHMAANKECAVANRIPIPTGAEFTVPFDTEMQLGPNDWEDGTANNEGALIVEVERAASRTAPATERTRHIVQARFPRTFAGRFNAGEYARITVKGGGWNNHPGAPLVGAAGHPTEKCGAAGHQCVGGEGLPLMSLILLMSRCDDQQLHVRESRTERAYIPDGAEVLLEGDANLYLAPNDFEDAFTDNSGSARVRVRVLGK